MGVGVKSAMGNGPCSYNCALLLMAAEVTDVILHIQFPIHEDDLESAGVDCLG